MDRRVVLLPFDGSPPSRRALEYVAAMDPGHGLHVHVLNVQGPTIDDAVFLKPMVDEGKRIVRIASQYLEARSISHTTGVAIGYPAETIVRTAKAQGCTDVVMGRRNALARFVWGSVSRRVVRAAGAPVTLVDPTGEAVLAN